MSDWNVQCGGLVLEDFPTDMIFIRLD